MNSLPELIKINVYRPLDGIRTPYTITLDRLRNVVSDLVDEDELNRIKSNPHLLARHAIAGAAASVEPKQLMAQSGLVRHVTDKGILISREPLDEWGRAFDDWLDTSKPNPFPETHDLRMEYFTEISDVSRRIEEGNCPGCELNRVQVVYRIKLRKLQGL